MTSPTREARMEWTGAGRGASAPSHINISIASAPQQHGRILPQGSPVHADPQPYSLSRGNSYQNEAPIGQGDEGNSRGNTNDTAYFTPIGGAVEGREGVGGDSMMLDVPALGPGQLGATTTLPSEHLNQGGPPPSPTRSNLDGRNEERKAVAPPIERTTSKRQIAKNPYNLSVRVPVTRPADPPPSPNPSQAAQTKRINDIEQGSNIISPRSEKFPARKESQDSGHTDPPSFVANTVGSNASTRISYKNILLLLYTTFLLWLPWLYADRVIRINQHAQNAHLLDFPGEAEWAELDYPEPYGNGIYSADRERKWDEMRYKASWRGFVDELIKEWKTLNLVSTLMMAAVLAFLQLPTVAQDRLTAVVAVLSLQSALMSLLYGCAYAIRFNVMKQKEKALAWAAFTIEDSNVIWGPWVMLALPSIWLAWSMILFIISILAFTWRGYPEATARDFNFNLACKISITAVMAIGLFCFCFIIQMLRAISFKEVNRRENSSKGSSESHPHPPYPPPPSQNQPHPQLDQEGSMRYATASSMDRKANLSSGSATQTYVPSPYQKSQVLAPKTETDRSPVPMVREISQSSNPEQRAALAADWWFVSDPPDRKLPMDSHFDCCVVVDNVPLFPQEQAEGSGGSEASEKFADAKKKVPDCLIRRDVRLEDWQRFIEAASTIDNIQRPRLQDFDQLTKKWNARFFLPRGVQAFFALEKRQHPQSQSASQSPQRLAVPRLDLEHLDGCYETMGLYMISVPPRVRERDLETVIRPEVGSDARYGWYGKSLPEGVEAIIPGLSGSQASENVGSPTSSHLFRE
ncbi:hypothetical protein AX16_004290 [Volvariella volvacea WC 439]|nr:hypothetical protein AX16_004290 [Volvariella volvacea WC 439]